MKELEDIIGAFSMAAGTGKKTALATVVHVDGSSYRRPGARMLIIEDGTLTGAISGGCLEGDALRKALLVIQQQRPMLVTYDTSDEEDAVMGLGLGCNGIIQVLIEPIDTSNPENSIGLLQAIATKRQYAVVITLFSLYNRQGPQPGTCILFTEDGNITGDTSYGTSELAQLANDALQNRQSSFHHHVTAQQNFTAFVEFIPPPVSLVIIGAGNDVVPLAAMASLLGWSITVIDGRPAYAKKERFHPSCQVLLAKPEQVMGKVLVDNRTAVVLMTHNYNYDCSLLPLLVAKNIGYTGMLGPRKKLERILSELKDKGIVFTPTQLAGIHSPVGLDIGAETPEEIALSIVAEIQAAFTTAAALPLKNNTTAIHNRSALAIKHPE